MDDVIMTLTWPVGGKPSMADAARALSVEPSHLDSRFGVQLIDRRENVYAVRCTASDCAQRGHTVENGPYANPAIGIFGDFVE